MGTVEQDLFRYEREQDKLAREEDWILDKITDLMADGEDYAPWEPNNFLEAINNLSKKELADILKKDSKDIGDLLCAEAYTYWHDKARDEADKLLEKEKEEAVLYRAEAAGYFDQPPVPDWSPRGW